MTRRQPQSSTAGSEASYFVDAEAARTERSGLTSPHPLGTSPQAQPPMSPRTDPLLSEPNESTLGDEDQEFILVNGQLFPKPATPTDAPPPYAPYPAGRVRAQTFTAGSPLVALPPLPQYRRESAPGGTETTPLLGTDGAQRVEYGSPLGYIIKGDERGYWSTLCDGAAWKSLFHTLVLNFPFVSWNLPHSELTCLEPSFMATSPDRHPCRHSAPRDTAARRRVLVRDSYSCARWRSD